MWDYIRADFWRRVELISAGMPRKRAIILTLYANGFWAVMLFRLADWFKNHRLSPLYYVILKVCEILTGVDLRGKFGKGFCIMHGRGVVVSRHSVCGSNLTIFQGVTIGSKRLFHGVQTQKKSISKAPRILNNVTIYAGAAVIGDIEIGNNVTIGANAVVLKDVPSGSTAVGNPAKIKKNVKKR